MSRVAGYWEKRKFRLISRVWYDITYVLHLLNKIKRGHIKRGRCFRSRVYVPVINKKRGIKRGRNFAAPASRFLVLLDGFVFCGSLFWVSFSCCLMVSFSVGRCFGFRFPGKRNQKTKPENETRKRNRMCTFFQFCLMFSVGFCAKIVFYRKTSMFTLSSSRSYSFSIGIWDERQKMQNLKKIVKWSCQNKRGYIKRGLLSGPTRVLVNLVNRVIGFGYAN